MVFYRKYRPQTLDELIGQEAIKSTLKNAHTQDRLSHAYLLVGPRGTGKTSTARIIAKMVNCEAVSSSLATRTSSNTNEQAPVVSHSDQRTTSNEQLPCNSCSSCLSITDGSNMDLIEIDAASNRGIEDIRDLREKIKLAPTSAKKKVYIIDEVHMLSTDAFNALLKTLEEPPAHVLFILATTEAQKVPVTILSRVQRLDFKLASTQDLVTALENIVKSEKIEVEDGVLQVIAKKADGSFRDAVKLLDQVASEGGKITLKKVEDGLKETSFAIKLNILEKIAQKDATAALSLVLEQVNSGTNSKELVFSLMDSLRSALLIKNNLGESVKKELGEDKYNQLVKLSELFTTENIVATFNYLQEALEKMKTAAIPSFPLEVAVIESCAGKMIQSTVTVIETPVIDRPQVESHSLKDDQVIVSNVSELVLEVDESKEVVFSEGMLLLKDKWNYILETVRPTNFSLEALLRQVNITECSDAQVVFEVPYSFHQRIIEAPKSRDLLEAVLSDVLGRQVRVATVLGKRPVTPEDIANVEVAADDEIIRVAAEIFNS